MCERPSVYLLMKTSLYFIILVFFLELEKQGARSGAGTHLNSLGVRTRKPELFPCVTLESNLPL